MVEQKSVIPDENRPAQGLWSRPTVGVLVTTLTSSWESDFVNGISDAASEQEMDVLVFEGGMPYGDAARNQIFELATTPHLDSMIMSTILGNDPTPEQLDDFYAQYAHLPVVSGALEIAAEVPQVFAENYGGMHAAVTHLVVNHGYRRIAFIQGPPDHPEALQRYQAYRDVLEEHDLPFDPEWVLPGSFNQTGGQEAVRLLLARTSELPDAIVAANDGAAVGVYQKLTAQGIRVPEEVALFGFDDNEIGHYLPVPLSSVRQSFYLLGREALTTLSRLMQGESVPSETISPAQLVIRRSCGCLPERVIRAASDDGDDHPPSMAEDLWEGFLQAWEEERAAPFLHALDLELRRAFVEREDIGKWHDTLSSLRQAALDLTEAQGPQASARLADWLQQARVLVSETASHLEGARRSEESAYHALLREFSATLGGVQGLSELLPPLEAYLPHLGVTHCYVVQYSIPAGQPPHLREEPSSPRSQARLMIAYADGHTSLEDTVFATRDLLPPAHWASARLPSAYMVIPLVVREQLLGYVVLGGQERTGVYYRQIAERLSSVLFRLRLLAETEQARLDTEAALQTMSRTRVITERVRRAVDTEAILRTALEELNRVLGTTTGMARLGTHEELLQASEVETGSEHGN